MQPDELQKIQNDFPILKRDILGNRLVYLDNAATSQKPQEVIDSLVNFYSKHNANVHRGIHTLSEESTDLYEGARKKVADFIGASRDEIIFTKGATESLNRIVFEYGLEHVAKGDRIVISEAEHHSNFVPWQILAQRTGAELVYLEVDDHGYITNSEIDTKINSNTKIVAIAHASNTLGTIFPLKEIVRKAKQYGAVVCVDGAQAIPHLPVNVRSLDVDFYAFSGHKMLGPTGIGVLYGKKALLEKLEPYEYGGGMIDEVSYENSTWAQVPLKYEAGTPNVAGAIGLGVAIDYLTKIGMPNIRDHEVALTEYALDLLLKQEDVRILGPLKAADRTGLISFTLDGIHGHDIASVLNSMGVAVRSGHHCTMPLHRKMGIVASTRASWYIYNSKEDIDALMEGLKKVRQILGK